jgi:hypothetical protein
MIKILTLKFGDKYGPEYVNRLYTGLLRNSSTHFDFYCYTDNPAGLDHRIRIKTIKPEDLRTYKGHWIKLMFHKTGFVEPGSKCLILDIDWVITGNVDDILNYPLEHNTINTAYRWWSNNKHLCPMNGGIQMFYNGETNNLWEKYSSDPDYWRQYYYDKGDIPIKGMGEQNFINEFVNIPINFITPKNQFTRYSNNDGIQSMINTNWLKFNYDPILINDELCEDIKMIHFTSDFDNIQDDNPISAYQWISRYWYD